MGCHDACQVSRAARRGDDDLKSPLLSGAGEFGYGMRRAVRAHHVHFIGYGKLIQSSSGGFNLGPIAIAAHDNGNFRL